MNDRKPEIIVDNVAAGEFKKGVCDFKYTFEVLPFNQKSSFEITYGFGLSPFGKCLIGMTTGGICHLSFIDNNESLAIEMLANKWPHAKLIEYSGVIEDIIKNIFTKNSNVCKKIHLMLQGTDFQVKVWQALASIREGETTSYENIARMIGKRKAVRATASAIAKNPIGYLLPCHRIISKSGKIHKYRWGPLRKTAILNYEAKHLRKHL